MRGEEGYCVKEMPDIYSVETALQETVIYINHNLTWQSMYTWCGQYGMKESRIRN
jgi:hypothetical protein